MDYDVLTANDFAGEALLSLNAIPGVAAPGVAQGFDNTFHGLKQIDLVLMHQLNKRTWSCVDMPDLVSCHFVSAFL